MLASVAGSLVIRTCHVKKIWILNEYNTTGLKELCKIMLQKKKKCTFLYFKWNMSKKFQGMWFFYLFLRTWWRNIGCSMFSDLELETSECTPTHPPTAYWQNTGRISSKGLTVNAPPDTEDTFNYNNLMWSNCPWSQTVQNISLHWLDWIPDVLWNMEDFQPPPLPLHLCTLASVFTHSWL